MTDQIRDNNTVSEERTPYRGLALSTAKSTDGVNRLCQPTRYSQLPSTKSPQPVDRSWTFHHVNVKQPHIQHLRLQPAPDFSMSRHSQRRAKRRRQCKSVVMHTSIFCAIGGRNPAHSLRFLLLRAGIESNPGPCDHFGDEVKTQHLTCSQCNAVC